MRTFIVLILSLIIFSACALDDKTVAVVGDFKVSLDEFKANLANRYGQKDSYESVSEENKNTTLEQLILRKQKLNAAYDMGLDEDEDIIDEYNARKRQMLANAYYEKIIVDEIAPDSLVMAEFEKTKYEVNASHVLISFAGVKRSMNSRSKEQAYTLAKTISYKVRSGADIGKMAMEYSDDRTKAENKGNLGYFVWGRMVDAFQEAAYKLNIHEVSDPVLTEFGYHVIYLNDKRENPNFNMANLDKEREAIKKRIYYRNRDIVKPKWDEHLKELKEKYEYRLTPAISEFIVKNNEHNTRDSLDAGIIKSYGPIVLAEWENGSCTAMDLVNSYIKRGGGSLSKFKATLLDSFRVKRDLDQFATHMFVAQVSDEKGYLTDESKKELDNFMEYSLISLVEKKSVTDKVDATDEEMQKYYADNKAEFTLPDKMEMWEIFVSDQKKAKQIYQYATSGRDFEQLASTYSEDKSLKKSKGKLGFRTKTNRGAVSQKAFEAGPNQILEPFAQKNGWTIVKTGLLKDGEVREFEKSKRQIAGKIRSEKSIKLKEAWETQLKETYPAEINMELLPKI
jgi:parvulin-like peptidyl-prolyl isomerase